MRHLYFIPLFSMLIVGCSSSPVDTFQKSENFNNLINWSKEQQCENFNLSLSNNLKPESLVVSCDVNLNHKIDTNKQIEKYQQVNSLYDEYAKYNRTFMAASSKESLSEIGGKSKSLSEIKGKILIKQDEAKKLIELSKVDSSKIKDSYRVKQELDSLTNEYNLLLMYNAKEIDILSSSLYNSKKYFTLHNVAEQDYANDALIQMTVFHKFNKVNYRYEGSSIYYFFKEPQGNSVCVKNLDGKNDYLNILTRNVDIECFENREYEKK